MIKKLKYLAAGALIGLSFVSCDNSVDYFKSINQNPHITVLAHGDTLTRFNDSIKTGFPLVFDYYIKDEESLQLVVLDEIDNFQVDIDEHTFSINCNVPGRYNLELGCFDTFDNSFIFPINTVVFDNLKPVCILTARVLSGFEIEVFAGNSYDRDARFGGLITLYEYDLDGLKFESKSSSVKHFFGSYGQKKIRARVKDNNNEWSTWKSTLVVIK